MIFDTFKDKSVLITGHTGFKGSWLALWLSMLGAKVHGYSLPPNTEPNHYTITHIHDVLASECLADILERDTLSEYIKKVKPDCIFHLAAQPLVRKSYAEPVETFDTNIMGSIHVMDAVRLAARPCTIIMITSDKCYQNINKTEGYVEKDRLGGYDPYSASKAAAEIVISSYRDAFFQNSDIHLASVRAGNVIGGGDWAADRIIPDAVRAVITDKKLELRSPQAVRPWQHVLEPLSGYMLLAAKMMNGAHYEEAWNFGPAAAGSSTVLDIITEFYKVWGDGQTVFDQALANLHETAILTLSSEKAMHNLGWKPRWLLAETIEKTAAWYRDYYQDTKLDVRARSLKDIMDYMKEMEI